MKMISLIAKRELKSYFRSPLAYVLAALFIFINGWIFFNLLINYINNIQNMPPEVASKIRFEEAVILKMFGNINFILLFVCPLLSMRLFSEEKRQGSIDLLYSAPINEWQIVIGKYLSGITVGLFIVLSTIIFPLVLSFSGLSDWNLFLSGYMGVCANLLFYMALGLFASGLTQNSIVAAILAFILIFSTWLITWGSQITSNYMMVELLRYLGIVVHFENLAKGVLNSSDIVYYLAFIFFGLFLSKKTLEARNW